MDVNLTLINALDTYLADDIPDLKGDTTTTVNAISKCKDYLLHNTVTTDWIIMSPAVKSYRKSLKEDIHHARLIDDIESLTRLLDEYDLLAPYIELFKQFPKFSV